MSTMRKVAIALTGFFLTCALLLLPTVYSIQRTLGDAEFIKSTLAETDFYDNIVKNIFELIASSEDSEIDAQQLQEIVPIIDKVLAPELLQNNTEIFIDSIKAWASGETKTPNFTIDLTEAKVNLTTELSSYVKDRITALPVCTNAGQLENYDAFSASCRPPVMPSDVAISDQVNRLLEEIPVINEGAITHDDIFADDKTNTEAIEALPIFMQWFSRTPLMIAGLVIALVAAMFAFSKTLSKGLRLVGLAFAVAGVLILINYVSASLIYSDGFNSMFNGAEYTKQADIAKEILSPIIQRLINELNRYHLYFGVVYAIVGTICLVSGYMLKRRDSDNNLTPSEPQSEPNHEPKLDNTQIADIKKPKADK